MVYVGTGLTKDPNYSKNYQKRYFQKYPERYVFWQAKGRSRKNNLPFDLTYEDIKTPDICPILGIPLFRNIGKNKSTGNSPSLDRIDPKRGYIQGNIQIISQRANVMKNDASVEELQRFADWVNQTYPR